MEVEVEGEGGGGSWIIGMRVLKVRQGFEGFGERVARDGTIIC